MSVSSESLLRLLRSYSQTSSAMDVDEVQQLINERVDSSLRSHRQEMLSDIEKIVEKISGSSNVSQLNKLSTLVNGGEKFKRKSNEEQFRYNSSVSLKLEEAEHSLEAQNIQAGREKTIEGNRLFTSFNFMYVTMNVFTKTDSHIR